MSTALAFRRVAGGPKGLFLAMRYVFVASTAYLLLSHADREPLAAAQALTIAAALASNVLLSRVPSGVLFAVRLAGPILIADTLWVTWALHATGTVGSDFFLLYFLVLLLAAVGEHPLLVALGAAGASAVSLHTAWQEGPWTAPVLLRVVFLCTVALFYGHVLGRLRHERRRGDRSAAWARSLERQVAARTAELHRLYDASRDASRAKTEFLASMSHEVRTPLHIIIGYTEMMLEDATATAASVADLAGRIRRAATGLLALVDDVIEMSRLESGHVSIDRRPVSAVAFAEALRQREWIAPLPGVALRWAVDTTDAEIETDPGKLEIVVANLVTNAIKYTREGEVAVTIGVREDGGPVEFRVADTGPGIPEARLARLREPFHESTGSGAHGIEGVGLGLAIVYRYAALLGAEVRVHSAVGRGTSFVVTMPRRVPAV